MLSVESILLVLSVITLFLLLCTIVFYFVFYNKSIIQNYQRELQNSRLSSVDSTTSQIELMQWIGTIETLKKGFKKERERLSLTQRIEFDLSFYNKWLNFSNDEVFFALIDEKLNGYLSNIRKDYPNLSVRDLKLLMCYLLKIPDSEISTLFNYSILSIPTLKNRLCKKLGVSHASELFSFLYNRLV